LLDQALASQVSERLPASEKGKYMKAVKFNEYGGTDVLRVVEVEAPHAGPGQVRIAVRAAGGNPIDWKLRAGTLSFIGR
jgi:NADPH:quinone reductase-like Zn-dependent oxidoreductase